MSIFHKLIDAVSLVQSEDARGDARKTAYEAATPGDWLAQILDHHRGLEQAFAAVMMASDNTSRTFAFRHLGVLLMGHAIAEEAVIYPAVLLRQSKVRPGGCYDEQAVLKVQMALLERLNPMSQAFVEKLGQVRDAAVHHMYFEEGKWFIELKREATPSDQAMLTERYAEEYERYVGGSRLWQ